MILYLLFRLLVYIIFPKNELSCNVTNNFGASPHGKTGEAGQPTHPKVGTEDVWVGAGHLQNTLDTLTQQLRRVQVLQDGLQAAHHKLKHRRPDHQPKSTNDRTEGAVASATYLIHGLFFSHFTFTSLKTSGVSVANGWNA